MMKRKGVMKKGVAIAVAAITVFASASTILAYEPFTWTDEYTNELSYFGEFGDFSVADTFMIDINDYDFNISDTIFIYEDGTQVAITNETLPYVLCNHTMVDGYYSIHSSNGSGGCTVYVYNAQRCSKCGYLKAGSLYATHTYTVCPH